MKIKTILAASILLVSGQANAVTVGGTFPSGAFITEKETIIVESLSGEYITFTAQDGSNYFDVVFRDAQNISIVGNLNVTAENILFEFTDGTAPLLENLNISGIISLVTNLDSSSDTTVLGDDLQLVSTVPVSPVPIPAAIWLFGTALIGLIGFGRRKAGISA